MTQPTRRTTGLTGYPTALMEWDLDQDIWTVRIIHWEDVWEDLGWFTDLDKAIAAVNEWKVRHGV
jgi:thymidylate synthase